MRGIFLNGKLNHVLGEELLNGVGKQIKLDG